MDWNDTYLERFPSFRDFRPNVFIKRRLEVLLETIPRLIEVELLEVSELLLLGFGEYVVFLELPLELVDVCADFFSRHVDRWWVHLEIGMYRMTESVNLLICTATLPTCKMIPIVLAVWRNVDVNSVVSVEKSKTIQIWNTKFRFFVVYASSPQRRSPRRSRSWGT